MNIPAIQIYVKEAYRNYKTDAKAEFNKNMINIYKEGIENPSIIHMILKNQIREEVLSEKDLHIENPKQLIPITLKKLYAQKTLMTDELSEHSKVLQNAYEESYKKLYPRTYRIRKQIIDKFNFSLNSISPRKNYYEKIDIFEPEDGWKSIYPRSYKNRARLLGMNRIGQKGKVSKFKKIFWNNKYLEYIDITNAALKLAKYW